MLQIDSPWLADVPGSLHFSEGKGDEVDGEEGRFEGETARTGGKERKL